MTEGLRQTDKGSKAEGLVLKNYGGFYYVQDSRGDVYQCRPRGKVQERILSGDRVTFQALEHQQGVLESILPRRNELYRPRAANVSLVLIVMAHQRPRADLGLLDRMLLIAEYKGIAPAIILNKCDLPRDGSIDLIESCYRQLGYRVVFTSSRTMAGIAELKDRTANEIAVFAGPSGAGKSSLLYQLSGQRFNPPTQELSKKTDRGKHTTRHTELFPLDNGGWIVDTPGFSLLELPRMEREELRHHMPELRRYGEECRFGDCLHDKESHCAVKAAAAGGDIAPHRYKNYLAMLEEIVKNERDY